MATKVCLLQLDKRFAQKIRDPVEGRPAAINSHIATRAFYAI
jgi:hypothetical protein